MRLWGKGRIFFEVNKDKKISVKKIKIFVGEMVEVIPT